MLKSLTLKNYMSYVKHTFNFDSPSLVSVCGNIGSGKSAMLEAINYALYGVSKVTAKHLVRIGCDSMECRLILLLNDSTYEIIRGVRSSDKGYVSIKLNNEQVAIGRNAQNYIDELLGVDGKLFNLTSFFGAGDDDMLVDTVPYQRLETMQVVANIDPFSKFHKITNSRRNNLQTDINTLKKVISVKRGDLPNVGGINKRIKDTKDELNELLLSIGSAAQEEKRLSVEVEQASSFIAEKDELVKSVSGLIYELNETRDLISDNNEDIKSKTEKVKNLIKERENYKKEQEIYTGIGKLKKTASKYREKIINLKASLDVYKSGVSLSDKERVNKCPLCASDVKEDTVEKWKNKIVELKKEIIKIEDKLKKTENEIATVKEVSNNIEFLDREIDSHNLNIESIKERLKDYFEQETKYKQEIDKKEMRIERLKVLLKESVDVKDRYEKVKDQIIRYHTKQGELEADIKNCKNQLKARENALVKIRADEKKLKQQYEELQALNLLCEGFSRYGIPFDLLEGLKRKVSKEASLLYSYFSDGNIEIRDVQFRGKPGVEYVLIDELGERVYEVLSTGQKALVGLCIRLAVSFILRTAKNIDIDLLILDEIAGNLDPKKRDSLVRVITNLLKKYFGQVFMVSHAAVRDVFTHTFNVSISGGKSAVERI